MPFWRDAVAVSGGLGAGEPQGSGSAPTVPHRCSCCLWRFVAPAAASPVACPRCRFPLKPARDARSP
jgi:hypothetical protein